MAGGEHARVVPCITCFGRAERTHEGLEDDQYRCENGHVFGTDWSVDGPPSEPQWPPTDKARALWAQMQEYRRLLAEAAKKPR